MNRQIMSIRKFVNLPATIAGEGRGGEGEGGKGICFKFIKIYFLITKLIDTTNVTHSEIYDPLLPQKNAFWENLIFGLFIFFPKYKLVAAPPLTNTLLCIW